MIEKTSIKTAKSDIYIYIKYIDLYVYIIDTCSSFFQRILLNEPPILSLSTVWLIPWIKHTKMVHDIHFLTKSIYMITNQRIKCVIISL